MSSTDVCIERALVDAHFAATISARDERSMRGHITTCAACRGHYKKRLLLAKLDPEAIPAEDRLANGLGFSRPVKEITPARKSFPTPLVISALALAAVLFLFLRSPKKDDGFTPRGSIVNGSGASAETAAAKINVYRVPKGGSPTLLVVGGEAGTSIARTDELAFAYQASTTTSPSSLKETHLMIFGVDERGHVFWFHPAWSNEAENPSALKIEEDQTPHELREAIRHQLDGERLEIHGLFLDRPLTVREAEAALKTRSSEFGPVTVPGGTDHVIMLGVVQ